MIAKYFALCVSTIIESRYRLINRRIVFIESLIVDQSYQFQSRYRESYRHRFNLVNLVIESLIVDRLASTNPRYKRPSACFNLVIESLIVDRQTVGTVKRMRVLSVIGIAASFNLVIESLIVDRCRVRNVRVLVKPALISFQSRYRESYR